MSATPAVVGSPVVGVLGLQGDVREHYAAVDAAGARPVVLRRPSEVDDVDGVVLPGGESTTLSRLLDIFDLRHPLEQRLKAGMPAFGSCAGMILLAQRVLDGHPEQRSLGCLDITVRRNAFGRQVDSFETDLDVAGVPGGPVHGVFIRAPWVESAGADVAVLARLPAPDRIVAVRQGSILATAFHPELTQDGRMHRYFVDMVRAAGERRR